MGRCDRRDNANDTRADDGDDVLETAFDEYMSTHSALPEIPKIIIVLSIATAHSLVFLLPTRRSQQALARV